MTRDPETAGPLERDFRRVHPLSPLLRVGVFVVAGIVATWQQVLRDLQPLMVLVSVAGFVVVGLVYGLLSWWFTRYRIDADELRIDSGVLLRRSRRIRIERLQAVDVVQPFLARVFGMAELRFEVAGGSRTEAPLAYLPLAEARRLRTLLLDREQAVAPYDEGGAPKTPEAPDREQEAARPPAGREIARVRPEWLVVGALLSTEFVGSVFTVLVVVVVSLLLDEPAGLALVLPAVLGAGSVLVRSVVGQWGFVLSDTGRGWRLRSGLLDLRSQTVPLDRVQGVALVEPLLWRRLGWVRVQVDVAGYAGSAEQTPTASTLLPVAPRAVARSVLQLLPGEPASEMPMVGAPRQARFLRPVGWRYLGVGADPQAVLTTRGWLQRRTDIVPHHKTQSIRVRQGPLQRWLGLLDVHVQTTPGPVDAVAKHRRDTEVTRWVTDELDRARAARLRHDPRGQARSASTHQKSPSPVRAVSSAASDASPSDRR